jgi:hypothetical protein
MTDPILPDSPRKTVIIEARASEDYSIFWAFVFGAIFGVIFTTVCPFPGFPTATFPTVIVSPADNHYKELLDKSREASAETERNLDEAQENLNRTIRELGDTLKRRLNTED